MQTTSRRDEIVKLREAGLTYAQIGHILGISKQRVRQILKLKPPPHKPNLQSRVMLTVSDVAQLLGMHPNTVRHWSEKGILKAYRIGPRRDRRFRREDVASFLSEQANDNKPGNKICDEHELKQFQDIMSAGKIMEPMATPLTYKETQILNYIAEGNSNRQIANILGISEQTIKNHVSAILRKLNTNDRTHAVVLAMRNGWISAKGKP